MSCSRLRLLVWAATVLGAAAVNGDDESLEARRTRLQRMTAAEKEQLRLKLERFQRLSKDEKKHLRDLHDQICCDAKYHQLREIMLRYNDWLKSLPSGTRTDLLSAPAEQRIAVIRKILFVLSSEEAWSLSKKYSAYNWARIDGRATETSEYHCSRSWTYTQAGDYAQAEREIERAIASLSEGGEG